MTFTGCGWPSMVPAPKTIPSPAVWSHRAMPLRASLLAFCLLVASFAQAVDFRIETKVFLADEEVPVSQNTTLFESGVIYDFAESPSRVAIFHQGAGDQGGRFLLLAPALNLKTEVDTARVDAALDKLGQWALRQENPLLRFAANPQFEEKWNEESGELALTGPAMEYKLLTTPLEQPNASRALANYWNWYAKLNCLLSPSLPPHARLEVNKQLVTRKLLPLEVNLTLSKDESTRLRAEHDYTWRLSKEDRDRIRLVGNQLDMFDEVSNEEFHAAEQQAARAAAKPGRRRR